MIRKIKYDALNNLRLPNLSRSIFTQWFLSIKKHIVDIYTISNTPQKFYLLATLMLCILDMGLWVIPSILITLALLMEFWPKFTKMWHSLEGKAVLLLFYATVANFALATAASVVNEVVTVSPSHFTYTHNFSILLYLPFWILGISFIVLLLMQLLMPLYLLLLLCAKPFGIKIVKFVSKSSYPMMTGLARFCLSTIVLSQLISSIDGGKQLLTFTGAVEEGFNRSHSEKSTDHDIKLLSEADRKQLKNDDEHFVLLDLYDQKAKELLAGFVFHIEADEFSRCQFNKKNKIIELNDYEVLEIAKDETQKHGYSYTVKKCISPAFPRS
jgi:hypothetical protein